MRTKREQWTCIFAVAIAVGACGPSVMGGHDGGGDAARCSPGTQRCEGNTLLVCQDGMLVASEECPNACDSNLGCVFCKPFTGTCSGEWTTMCLDDGSGFVEIHCDPLQGMSCDPEIGVCGGSCAPQNIGRNYIGCEYYPTVTGNEVDNNFTYAVAISNTSAVAADVHVEGGALTAPLTFSVAPGAVDVRVLPWEPTLKACSSFGQLECGAPQNYSALVVDGAYHLRSSEPVTVYQFNPLDYVAGSQFSYTNDASLLLPVNAMTPNYRVATWPAWNTGFIGDFPSLMAITATQAGTTASITTTAATVAGTGAPAFSPGVAQNVTLDAGDVLQLFATMGDLTGSAVAANKPVQVIGGHYCTQIPIGITACDHIEESIFPYETLSNKYIVAAPALPTLPDGKVEIIRIVATEPNTLLTYEPPQAGAPDTIAAAGSFVEIANNQQSFRITADKKIVVAQYMEGQDAGGGTGDPAMALAVPIEQYRTDYQFHAPVNYETNYVQITAPTGANIMLDGATTPLTGFVPIGSTDYGLLRVTLDNSGNGNHSIAGDQPFGITVYGYGQYTSFWYPGGLDLSPIVVE